MLPDIETVRVFTNDGQTLTTEYAPCASGNMSVLGGVVVTDCIVVCFKKTRLVCPYDNWTLVRRRPNLNPQRWTLERLACAKPTPEVIRFVRHQFALRRLDG